MYSYLYFPVASSWPYQESPANFSSKSGEKGAPLKGGKGSARKEPAKYELNVQSGVYFLSVNLFI